MRRKMIVGNWKMNPPTVLEAKSIFSKIKRTASNLHNPLIVICPSDVHLVTLAKLAGKGSVRVGVQDVFWEDQGFFTGQVSPQQAYDAGARFAIVGHSEKRMLGETNEQTAKKLSAAVRDNLVGILCIGEKERDREGNFFAYLKDQLLASLSGVTRDQLLKSVVVAYEPLWAIGRADLKAMSPSDVHETSIFIKKVIHDVFGADAASAVPILYGGSVSVENARSIVYDGEVDGLLVGRQSLDPYTFSEIMRSVCK